MSSQGPDVVKVHIVGTDVKGETPVTCEYPMGHSSFACPSTQTEPFMILGHAPKRRAAVINVNGLATDTAYIGGSRADVMGKIAGSCTLVQGGMVIPIGGTSEVWAIGNSGASIVISVITEIESRG